MVSIICCMGCVPPKRSPTCNTTCQEYLSEKEKSDAERNERNRRLHTEIEVARQRDEFARKAIRKNKIR